MKPILARSTVTEIFSPRGIGKSVFTTRLAVRLAQQRGYRVLLLDRDNPPSITRDRLEHWDAAQVKNENLKVMMRAEVPPLTNPEAWASFPYSDYDVVILDSLDSTAEGVGEHDSAKPGRALASLLDIAHRPNGPAVLILGNTVRTGKHSRGSGVIEDRADICYEVRDATGF